MPLSGCSGLRSFNDFGHAISVSLDIIGFSKALADFLQIFIEGSWEYCSWSPSPSLSVGVKYWYMASCAGLHVVCVSKQTPPSFGGRQAPWAERSFSVEGVRDSLWVSDADDLSQQTSA